MISGPIKPLFVTFTFLKITRRDKQKRCRPQIRLWLAPSNFMIWINLERPYRRDQVNKVFAIFCWNQGKRPQWRGEGDLNGSLTE